MLRRNLLISAILRWIQSNASYIADAFILIIIMFNVVCVILESVSHLATKYSFYFSIVRNLSYFIFSIEIVVRIFRIIRQSKRFKFSPVLFIDGLVIGLFYGNVSTGFDWRLLRLFRVLSILHITEQSRAMQILRSVAFREKRTLFSAMLTMGVVMILEAGVIYSIEHYAQPQAFSSIPDAIWWTMTTLTTVGYGDVVPLTGVGKLFGMLVMFSGIVMFAIPTGILVSAFFQEIKRKDFIATWDLVAQVPFFSNLTASEIAQITDLLTLHVVRPGEVIFHHRNKADGMYFIVSGEVQIETASETILLKGGEFFGEVAVLHHIPRTAKAVAHADCDLLFLNSRDIELFMELHPEMQQRIFETAERRYR